MQPQERIIFTKLQTLFQITNCLLDVAAQHSRGFEIELPQDHVSAACLKSLVKLEDSLHFFAYIFYARESGERAVLRNASIVRSQPEVSFRSSVLKSHRGFPSLYSFAKSVLTLALVSAVLTKVIISPR